MIKWFRRLMTPKPMSYAIDEQLIRMQSTLARLALDHQILINHLTFLKVSIDFNLIVKEIENLTYRQQTLLDEVDLWFQQIPQPNVGHLGIYKRFNASLSGLRNVSDILTKMLDELKNQAS